MSMVLPNEMQDKSHIAKNQIICDILIYHYYSLYWFSNCYSQTDKLKNSGKKAAVNA